MKEKEKKKHCEKETSGQSEYLDPSLPTGRVASPFERSLAFTTKPRTAKCLTASKRNIRDSFTLTGSLFDLSTRIYWKVPLSGDRHALLWLWLSTLVDIRVTWGLIRMQYPGPSQFNCTLRWGLSKLPERFQWAARVVNTDFTPGDDPQDHPLTLEVPNLPHFEHPNFFHKSLMVNEIQSPTSHSIGGKIY